MKYVKKGNDGPFAEEKCLIETGHGTAQTLDY
jgi:hypothetical protein